MGGGVTAPERTGQQAAPQETYYNPRNGGKQERHERQDQPEPIGVPGDGLVTHTSMFQHAASPPFHTHFV